MSNVERLNVDGSKVDLLLNKAQRHRGDTLNSGLWFTSNIRCARMPELTATLSIATVSAQVTSPLEGVIGVKLIHWY